jgi:hypothetical protein
VTTESRFLAGAAGGGPGQADALELADGTFEGWQWSSGGPAAVAASGPATASVVGGPLAERLTAALLAEVSAVVAGAHTAALRAHTAMQRREVAALLGGLPPAGGPVQPGWFVAEPGDRTAQLTAPTPFEIGPAEAEHVDVERAEHFELVAGILTPIADPGPRPVPVRVRSEAEFKPLARTGRDTLGPAELAQLAVGASIPAVFGPTWDQQGCNPSVGLTKPSLLAMADGLSLRGGARGLGSVRVVSEPPPGARPDWYLEVTEQAAQLVALYLGLHLCLADAVFIQGHPPGGAAAAGAEGRTLLEVLAAPGAGALVAHVEVSDCGRSPGFPSAPPRAASSRGSSDG